jgi:hypothetical protein
MTYPEEDFPEKERKLKGFIWRNDERPKSIEDLFADDPPLNLPKIKGLEEYKPQKEFFDEELRKRIDDAATSKKNKKSNTVKKDQPVLKLINKAARNLPPKKLNLVKNKKLKTIKEN